jgi:hypothetical protein
VYFLVGEQSRGCYKGSLTEVTVEPGALVDSHVAGQRGLQAERPGAVGTFEGFLLKGKMACLAPKKNLKEGFPKPRKS